MKYHTGATYDGDWKFGRKDGYGEYHFANGQVYKGKFRNGKMIEQLKIKQLDRDGI